MTIPPVTIPPAISSPDPRRPRNIVHVLPTANVRGTAQVRILASLGRVLDPERYRLRAWFMEEGGQTLPEELAAAGVPSRMVGFRGRTHLVGGWRVARALRADAPALIHLHGGGRSLLWLLHALAPAMRLAHLHTDRSEDGAPLALDPLVRGVHAAIATSRAVAAAVPRSTKVIYPGVEISEPKASVKSKPRTIGAASRLEPIKGLSALLEAVAILRGKYPDLVVELAGAGTCEGRLRSLASTLGIESSVNFLGWREDLDTLHRRWRVFVQPSIYEGFGLGALEAMAAGLPVVASATGGLLELVEDGQTGFLVPVGAPEALADRLGRLLEDEVLRARMGEAARRRVEERFTVAQMAAQIEAVYDRLLGE